MMLLFLVQAAAAQPDIQLGVRLTADRVTIEKKGEARLTVTADPDGGSRVDVKAPEGDGKRTLRNVSITVDAEARIADRDSSQGQETAASPPR